MTHLHVLSIFGSLTSNLDCGNPVNSPPASAVGLVSTGRLHVRTYVPQASPSSISATFAVFQDPSGINAHTAFTYDVYGNLDTVTDANSHITDLDFNELGWLVKVTNPLTYVTDYSHDENGNVRFIRRQADDPRVPANDQVTEFTYDVLNNVKMVTDPLSRVTTFNYDLNYNLGSVVDAETNTTTYVHDERDLLFTVTDANTPQGVTTYDYDLNGNLERITDAENNATTYTYDLFDRQDVMTYADLSTVDFDYDKNSNLDFVTLPGTHGTIDFIYDELNRLTNKNFPSNPSRNITFDYDLGSRLKVADNASSEIDYNYDALNRVDDVTQRVNATNYFIDYTYDDVGNLDTITYPSTKLVDYDYDVHDRLDIVKVNTVQLVDYDYDPLDRRDTKTFSTTPDAQRTTYQFDIANQLTSLTNTVLPSTNISIHSHPVYDNVGNRKQYDRTFQANPLETINYGYNDIYELTSVTGAQTNSYSYDNVGNRVVADGVSYTPNNLNQYTDVGGSTPTYDDNGNLTADGNGKNFTYDELNRLITYSDAGTSASYEYDAFNRRVAKTVGAVTTYFVYDDQEVLAEYDSGGALNAEYVLTDTIDEILTMDRGGSTYYYQYDSLGSVSELTDSTGAVAENYTYDAYGNITSALSLVGNPYYYTGRRYDDESGTYYYRNRNYSNELGRFLQRDPLNFEDSMNLYSYVLNSPLNWIDPFGEARICHGVTCSDFKNPVPGGIGGVGGGGRGGRGGKGKSGFGGGRNDPKVPKVPKKKPFQDMDFSDGFPKPKFPKDPKKKKKPFKPELKPCELDQGFLQMCQEDEDKDKNNCAE